MRFIGLDLGTKTIGVSISDATNTIALPIKTLHFKENNPEEALSELKSIMEEKNITDIVLGLPKNMDNSLGFAAQRSLEFAEILKANFSLPIHLVDERLSTKEAENILLIENKSRKKRKKVIDNVASSIILDTFLRERREKSA